MSKSTTKSSAAKPPMKLQNMNKIFISNIKLLSRKDIHKHFEKFGAISSISLVIHIKNHQRREYGFIQFDNIDSVDKAIHSRYQTVNGCVLTVKKYVDREQRRKEKQSRELSQQSGLNNNGLMNRKYVNLNNNYTTHLNIFGNTNYLYNNQTLTNGYYQTADGSIRIAKRYINKDEEDGQNNVFRNRTMQTSKLSQQSGLNNNAFNVYGIQPRYSIINYSRNNQTLGNSLKTVDGNIFIVKKHINKDEEDGQNHVLENQNIKELSQQSVCNGSASSNRNYANSNANCGSAFNVQKVQPNQGRDTNYLKNKKTKVQPRKYWNPCHYYDSQGNEIPKKSKKNRNKNSEKKK